MDVRGINKGYRGIMTISLDKFSRDFLCLLIVFYFAQGSLYPLGSVVAKVSLLLILLISSIFLLKTLLIESKKLLFYYTWLVLLILNFIGYLLAGVSESGFSGIYFSQIKAILTAILPFFPFYYFSYKGCLTREQLLRFFVILVPIAIASFYFDRGNIISENNNDIENIVTNTAYFFVALIPYIFLWGKRKVFSIISLVLLLFFIIQSAKRGALIVAVMGALVFIYYQLTTVDPKNRVKSSIVSIIGILLIIWFSYDFYTSNEFLINRIQKIDDGGSGREFIFLNLLDNWLESDSITSYLFGFGFVSTIKYSGTGNLAHNDWLELLTNFGLLGVFIYLLVFYALFSFILCSKAEREDKLMLLAIILIWFLQTLFSMYYTVSTTVLTSVLLGYLFGKNHCNRRLKNRIIVVSRDTNQDDN